MRVINDGLPEVLYQATLNDRYPVAGQYSISQLANDTPQQRALRLLNWDNIEEKASDRIWMVMGNALHMLLEKHGRAMSGHLAEDRLYAEVAGVKVSGKFDLYHAGVVSDWKFVGVATTFNGAKKEWIAQANSYAWLFRENGFEVTEAKIECIYRDWMDSKAGTNGYPPSTQTFHVPLWDHRIVERYLAGRVALMQAAEAGQFAECSPEERWERPTVWAVTKRGNKKASRLLDSEAEALSWAEANMPRLYKRDITMRPGESVRCRPKYCNASPFCSQRAAMKRTEAVDESDRDATAAEALLR